MIMNYSNENSNNEITDNRQFKFMLDVDLPEVCAYTDEQIQTRIQPIFGRLTEKATFVVLPCNMKSIGIGS